MVCPRCIRTVEKILGKLGIGYRSIVLGQVEIERELISYGDKSISEIAWELGFSSPAHFSAQFKKESGMSPKIWQNFLK